MMQICTCVCRVYSLDALSTMIVGVGGGVDANVVCGKLTADMCGALLCAEHDDFLAHRHDQSIFSVLTKKYSIRAHRVPTQYGRAKEAEIAHTLLSCGEGDFVRGKRRESI